MRRQVIRYLARAFVAGPRVDVSSPGMAQLAHAIGDRSLVPSHGQQGGAPRALLVTSNNEFLLAVNSEGFDLQFAPTDGARPSVTFSEFCERASNWLAVCLDFVKQPAHRLSAVGEQILLDLEPAEHARVRAGLLRVPDGLGEVEPFQWDCRMAFEREQDIGGSKETLFVVPSVKRVEAVLGTNRFDALVLTTDINTTPKRTVARFDAAKAREFFRNSAGWHEGLERAVLTAGGLG